MEREANYLAVGSFVLLVVVMGVLFVYWYSASSDHRFYVRYEIYFDGSVNGLSEGGPVRYLGVDVGRVLRIRIDPRACCRTRTSPASSAWWPTWTARLPGCHTLPTISTAWWMRCAPRSTTPTA